MTAQEIRREECASDFALDEMLAREVSTEDEARLRAHLEACERCRARLAAIELERTEFGASAPALSTSRRRRSHLSLVATAFAAAAGLIAALTAVVIGARDREERPDIDVRLKGAPRIGAYVHSLGTTRQVRDGDTVLADDSLRFVYSWDQSGYLAVLGIDGTGRADVYFPRGERAARVNAGHDVAVNESIVLDEVLGEERLFAYFCDDAVALSSLKSALARVPISTSAPDGCRVDRLTLVKVAR